MVLGQTESQAISMPEKAPPAPQSSVFKNLAKDLSDKKLTEIGSLVVDGYKQDEDSRKTWKERYENFTRLFYVRPEHDQKNEPWEKASNVVLPLINIACSQFWARAMDAIFSSKEIAKVFPLNPEEKTIKAADRVTKHLNYQLRYKMQNFYEGMSKSLMQLPLSGTVIRKTYYDSALAQNVSDFISPDKFVVNYNTRYLERSYRYTHVFEETLNDMIIKEQDDLYMSVSQIGTLSVSDAPPQQETEIKQSENENVGIDLPQTDSFQYRKILEQHTYLNLSEKKGEGTLKPYIVTVDLETETILRIVDRTNPNTGQPMQYFTKFEMLPSPDDGFYGVGFGMLLERINETANTIINQLIDAGTLATTQSGFVNTRSGIKRGSLSLKRGEWIETDLKTDDIRKAMMPLVFKEPSYVLFQLLGMLEGFTNKITTVSDMMTGEMPRSDTSATAVVSLLEQGLKVFSSIYRGLHNSFGKELQKLYDLNGLYLNEREYFNVVVNQDEVNASGVPVEIVQQLINREDYKLEFDVVPVSDPGIISKTEKVAKSQLLYQGALSNPLIANNPISLFYATLNYFSSIENNAFIVQGIMKPVQTQIELQAQAQAQAAQEQQLKQQALEMFVNQLAQNQVPQELINQFIQEQQIGQQFLQEQALQSQIGQGKRASTQ